MIYNSAIKRLDMPSRFLRLPVDERGFPVPRFVEWIDGKPDFRIMDGRFLADAVRRSLCWICGEKLGRHMVFVIGPMCAINRVSAEPPSHHDCASFAARACPFLTQPKRPRNDHGLPEGHEPPGGVMIRRNPGVTLLWTTQTFKRFRSGNGVVFEIGEPTRVEWFAHGRQATRSEILASIESGLPELEKIAALQGSEAIAALKQQLDRGLALVPA